MSTAIEWTDETWNPMTGCTEISAGCDNCYAFSSPTKSRGVRDVYLRHLPVRTLRQIEPIPLPHSSLARAAH